MDLNMTELKAELSRRGEDTRGTKAVLKERLEQVLKEEALNAEKGDVVPPPRQRMEEKDVVPPPRQRMEEAEDNFDQQSVGSVASMRALEEAKLAGLKARREALRKRHDIELKEAQLKQLKEEMEIDAEIAEGEAKEKVLSQYEGGFSKASPAPAPVVDSKKQTLASGTLNRVHQSDIVKQEPQLMKIKSLPLPRFDGCPREYPRFRSDFLTQVAPRCAKEALAYTLRTCLCKKAQDVVKVIDDDFEEMMKRLDEEYGDPSHMVDMIMSQIRRFRIPKEDRMKLLEFIDIVEKGYYDLKHLKMEHEMSNVGFVSLIETKLPDQVREKWAERVNRDCSNVDRFNKFPDLMKFLLETKKTTKYLSSEVRSSAPYSAARFATPQNRSLSHVRTMTGNVRSMNRSMTTCTFCGGPHAIDRCDKLAQKTEQEKKEYVMTKGLCFGCLRGGHRSKECRSRKTCEKCNERHPTALHRQSDSDSSRRETRTQVTDSSRRETPMQVTTGHTSTTGHTASGGAKLQAVKLKVSFGGESKDVTAFLDPGSTHSFISRTLVDSLHIKAQKKTSVIMSTINDEQELETSLVAQVVIRNVDGEDEMELPPLYVIERIPVAPEDFASQDDLRKWPHLSAGGVHIEDVSHGEVGLLIGANAAAVTEALEVIRSEDGIPYATRTRYGWILSGIHREARKSRVNRIQIMQKPEEFENFAENKKGLSREDIMWCLQVEDTCKMEDGKYEIGLPFRKGVTGTLPNNYVMAKQRLDLLKRRFAKNPGYAVSYRSQMEKLLTDGHAEKVPDEQASDDAQRWYLPHHSVMSVSKADKLRVVFDCAARYNDISLNDLLLQGPDLTNSLSDVLIRFRQEPVAFIADIEGMFLQVRVPEKHRDYLRFLWWPGGDTEKPVQEYRMTVHLFGATSSPSCANYALHRTAEDFGSEFDAEVTSTVRRNFYVDDVVKATSSEESAATLAIDLKQLCSKGGFNLTKFSSNRVTVLQALEQQDRAKSVRDLIPGQEALPVHRALGVLWDQEADELGFHVNIEAVRKRPVTRRGMLSATAACYDPLGLIAPYLLRGRMIGQELTRLAYGWDDSVPGDVEKAWTRWLDGLKCLTQFRIPRCVTPAGLSAAEVVELHHFADASQRGYGTASYIRTIDSDGEIHCLLLTSRTHLSPIKSTSIPRLELAAAKLAVQVNWELIQALDVSVSDVCFWTDSTAVLKYINNESTRYHVFVANRLAVIHDGSSAAQWRFVPSKENPADYASRGMNEKDLSEMTIWTRGPAFLQESRDKWPERPDVGAVTEEDPEVKTLATKAVETNQTNEDPVEKLIAHYSSWARLKRGVAWIQKTIQMMKKRRQNRDMSEDLRRDLSLDDIERAEKLIIKRVQNKCFSDEIEHLKAGRPVKMSSRIARLDPFLEDDLLRVGGRLVNSTLNRNAKHPLILPGKGEIIGRLVMDAHERAGHVGRQHVMAELRKNYWILRANSAVRRVLKDCMRCRRLHHAVEEQKMADLPKDRVEEGQAPFTNTGVDYFGPFFVRRGRAQVKRYGVIFTCLSVRAVHLEIAESLSTDSFICALRRFVARRGPVRLIRSDRGTNLKGAEKELKEELDLLFSQNDKIKKEMMSKGIEWKFNAPGASHHGGAWERMIRSIRKIMLSLMREQSFTDETLHTLMCEIECIINNRPLVPVSADPRDELPITPNHILHLRSVSLQDSDSSDGDIYGPKRWKQAAYLADQFWRRWRIEYLPLLQERTGPTTRSRSNMKTGDVVLLVDDTVPRGVWPLGRVEQAFLSADGRVRTVRVRVRGTNYIRPITKVVKIISI